CACNCSRWLPPPAPGGASRASRVSAERRLVGVSLVQRDRHEKDGSLPADFLLRVFCGFHGKEKLLKHTEIVVTFVACVVAELKRRNILLRIR
ncbi:Protein of unknown function, partial [Gryllus bimaculatus]